MQRIEIKAERRNSQEIQPFRWSCEFDSPSPIDRELLGGKGAGLTEMVRLGLPVPPGFILTTEVWRLFRQQGKLPQEVWREAISQLSALERKTGKKYGDKENPLIVSVRSGASYSMPGMMDTILNIGLTSEILPGLAQQTNENCANDSCRRLKTTFERVIRGELPQDPYLQLQMAIEAVFKSWDNPRAVAYRELHKIPEDAGTAVIVQTMVFGNVDEDSGVGVFFTRNPRDGRKEIHGEFVQGGQGEVVDGRGLPREIPPELVDDLTFFGEKLEQHLRTPQEIEFTVEKGKIFLLQSRVLRGTPQAKVKMTVDMMGEGLIGREEAYQKVTPADIDFLLHPGFDEKAEEEARKTSLLAKGRSASIGSIVGRVVFTPEEVKNLSAKGEAVVLVCSYLDPNDIETFHHLEGLIAAEGGAASHMAMVLQANGKVGILGVNHLPSIKRGEILSLDGNTGEIFRGAIPLAKLPQLSSSVQEFIKERRKALGESPWFSFLYPTETQHTRESFIAQIEKLESELQEWPSAKAQTVILLNALLPYEEIIPAVVLKPDDVREIREALEGVAKQKGRQNIPRTCHHPEKLAGAPYVIIPTEEEIEAFLNDPNYQGYPPKYGGLLKWKEDPTLVGIIVPAEPEGKINPRLAHEHFHFTVSCLSSWPPKIVVDLNLGTPLLRSLEHIKAPELIQITAFLNPEDPFCLGEIEFDFGEKYYNDLYAQKVAQLVADKVFFNWWQPPFSLPHVMSALDGTYGLSVLEGQGRMRRREELAWCLIYGAKGREEKEKVKEERG